jgi:hypothetical protein
VQEKEEEERRKAPEDQSRNGSVSTPCVIFYATVFVCCITKVSVTYAGLFQLYMPFLY